MSEIITFPPIDELPTDETGRILFPPDYPLDMLLTDENGLYIIPPNYPRYNEAIEANRERLNLLLLNKANVGDIPSPSDIDTYTKDEIDDLLSHKLNISDLDTPRISNRSLITAQPSSSITDASILYQIIGNDVEVYGKLFIVNALANGDNIIVTTLPVGFRPSDNVLSTARSFSGGPREIRCEIGSDGNVAIFNYTGATMPVNDGMAFFLKFTVTQ